MTSIADAPHVSNTHQESHLLSYLPRISNASYSFKSSRTRSVSSQSTNTTNSQWSTVSSVIQRGLTEASLADQVNTDSKLDFRNFRESAGKLRLLTSLNSMDVGKGLLCTMVSMFFLAFYLCGKLTFGYRTANDIPDPVVTISMARVILLSVLGPGVLCKVGWHGIKGELVRGRVWAMCFPFAAGTVASITLAFMSVQYISAASRGALAQGRLLLDLLSGHFLLGQSWTPIQGMLIVALIGAIFIHSLTVAGESSISRNPVLGTQLVLLQNLVASFINVWIPFIKHWLVCDNSVVLLVVSIEEFVISTIFGIARTGAAHMFHGFYPLDIFLVISTLCVDVSCFIVPVFVNPIALTLCTTVNIPFLYLIEGAFFGKSYELLPFMSVIMVGFLATIYFVYKLSIKSPTPRDEVAVQTDELTNDASTHKDATNIVDIECIAVEDDTAKETEQIARPFAKTYQHKSSFCNKIFCNGCNFFAP